MTVDARTAGAIDLRAPGPAGELATMEVGFVHRGGLSSTGFVTTSGSLFAGPLGPPVANSDYTAHVHAEWLRPGPGGSTTAGATYFGLAASQQGSMFAGYQRTWKQRELARVNEHYDPLMQGSIGVALIWPHFEGDTFTVAEELNVDLPSRRTEYFSTEPGTSWVRMLLAGLPGPDGELALEYSQLLAAPMVVQGGQRLADRWNSGPYMVTLPEAVAGYTPVGGAYGETNSALVCCSSVTVADTPDSRLRIPAPRRCTRPTAASSVPLTIRASQASPCPRRRIAIGSSSRALDRVTRISAPASPINGNSGPRRCPAMLPRRSRSSWSAPHLHSTRTPRRLEPGCRSPSPSSTSPALRHIASDRSPYRCRTTTGRPGTAPELLVTTRTAPPPRRPPTGELSSPP